MTSTSSVRGNVLLAFGLNIGAGLATCIGGFVPFSQKLISLQKPSRIGIALGLSAGVMLFISIVEIFGKSAEYFGKSISQDFKDGCDALNGISRYSCNGKSKSLTTVFFIIGAGSIFLLDRFVHTLYPDKEHQNPGEEMENLNQQTQPANNLEIAIPNGNLTNKPTPYSLNRTGILTAIAIGLHNLPEGIATFAAALSGPRAGFVMALGIALHNIPEGIAVATPVYLATKSKWKGLLYTFISALAEPLGGLICYVILEITKAFDKSELKPGEGELPPFISGIMFGLVVGMMVTISLKELIPTALKTCPSENKISISILVGMLIMALSLIIFDFMGMD